MRRLRLRGVAVADVHLVRAVEPDFAQAARALVANGEDPSLSVLGWHGPFELLAQSEAHGHAGLVVAIPDSLTQTRDWIATTVRVAPRQARGPRFVALEPTVASARLRALSDRFGARWRDPMDGVAWAMHQAMTIVASAAAARDGERLADALERRCAPGAVVVNERRSLTYWRDGRQLAHDVHVARAHHDAPGGHGYDDQLAFADFVGRVTAEGAVWEA